MIKAYYRLGRPVNALAGCLALLVSAFAAGAGVSDLVPVILAAIAVILITISANAWNDYLDIEIDRVNKPGRPLPRGEISLKGALYFSICGSLLSLMIAAMINLPAFLIVLASNLLLYLYSYRLKCSVLAGNAAVAAITSFCFIFGGVIAGRITPILLLAAIVFSAILAREVLKAMADYKGDFRQNCRTVAVVLGLNKAYRLACFFMLIAIVLMPLPYFIQGYGPLYLGIVLLILWPLYGYVAFKAGQTEQSSALEGLSGLLKVSFFIWFVAVIFGVGLAG